MILSTSQIKNIANICSSNPLEINKSNSVFFLSSSLYAIQFAGWEYFCLQQSMLQKERMLEGKLGPPDAH